MIEVKNLKKRYGNKLAVNDVSFTVENGEILGFLGPNGAGKSTTMNIITGYLSSTEGTVTIDGCEILEDPIGAKSKIGYLPEFPPLYPDMTVIKYLEFMIFSHPICRRSTSRRSFLKKAVNTAWSSLRGSRQRRSSFLRDG